MFTRQKNKYDPLFRCPINYPIQILNRYESIAVCCRWPFVSRKLPLPIGSSLVYAGSGGVSERRIDLSAG